MRVVDLFVDQLDLPALVARRMSLTTCSAGAFVVMGFFIIFNSIWGQDKPQSLRYAITLNCSMGADAGHQNGSISIKSTKTCAMRCAQMPAVG